MRRISEGLELPNDWGFFTNVGMTLDTVDPLFGLGSAKYNAANVEYATAPVLETWASYYVWTGKHFKMENPASSGPNWLFGWRSEGTPGNVVEGGCVGVKDSRFCFALGGGPSPVIQAIGRKLLLPDAINHAQFELWFAGQFGWFKVKLNNRVIPDLVFNGVTAKAGEAFLSQVWIGSLYGGGNGNCWIDDFVLNDQQPFQRQDQSYPGMVIIHSASTSGEGAYGQFDDVGGDQLWDTPLEEPLVEQASGVAETPISCTNQQTADVGCVIAVYGPITNPAFENVTAGESLSVTGVVPDGSRLVVNTGTHNVYLITPVEDSTNVFVDDWNAFVDPSPDWFVLAPGVNSIDVSGAAGNTVFIGWVSYEVGPTDSFTFNAKPAAPTPPIGTAGLASVDHVYRMKIEGSLVTADDKVIPGIRRSSADHFATAIEAHLFPTATLAAHIDRMRRDRVTNTPWNPANVDSTEAIFQYSNFSQANAQAAVDLENYATGIDIPSTSIQVTPPAPVTPPTPVVLPPPSNLSPPQPYPPPSPPVEVIGPGPSYWLSPTGSDSNAGTQIAPWKTFAYAIPRLNPGSTLYLRNGTYNAGNSGRFSISAKHGTAAAPIRIRAENERQAFIDGDGNVPFRVTNSSYLTFEGIRVKNIDALVSNPAGGHVVYLGNSNNLTLRRMLVSNNNRYYNGAIFGMETVSNCLIEENEVYSFHRNGLGGFAVSGCVFRRNYLNARNYADIPGGYGPSDPTTTGDGGYIIYPGSNNLLENNIAENTGSGFDMQPQYGPTINNRFYGNIALSCQRGFYSAVRGNSINEMARDTYIENFVALNCSSVGVYLRGTKNTIFKQGTILSGTGVQGVLADLPSLVGDGAPTVYLTNVLSANNVGSGFYVVGHPNWSLKYVNSYGNSTAFTPAASDPHITNELTVNPNLGSAKIFIPAGTPMKGVGLGGADIGANIIYRYQNGVLTSTPLWGPSFPHGAIIAGVNDIPGSSAYDVHTRLGTIPVEGDSAQAVLEDFTSIRLNGDGDPLFSPYLGEDPLQTGQLENGAYRVDVGNAPNAIYFHFFPRSGGFTYPNGYAQNYIKTGTWDPQFNRLRFWMKSSINKTRPSNGDLLFQVGTYVRTHATGSSSSQGQHYYHNFGPNIYANRWMLVEVNRHPQHKVGQSGSTNWPDNPEAGVGYFDGLTRFYIDSNNDGYNNSSWWFDSFEFRTAASEPDYLVASVTAVYSGTRYEVAWAGPKNSAQSYDVRYKTTTMKVTGFTSGTDGGSVSNPNSDYTGTFWQSPAMAEVPALYIAIRPTGSTDFTEIYLPTIAV